MLRLTKRHLSSSTSKAKLKLGIRREEKNRWERRVPLTPHHVQALVQQHGATVFVEPSNRRIFPDSHFEKAGAVITSDLSDADVIVGVKEVPIKDILPNKQYICFSHTHKAQPYNMPTLAAYLDKKCRLLDYELMTDEQGRRLIFFGRHAGYVGMIDCLHGLGQRMLGLGYHTPFMYIGMGHVYKSLAAAKEAVGAVGNSIIDDGIPQAFSPMIFTFTGAGNVSQGAQEIFQGLPHEYVSPSDLPSLYKSLHNKESTNRVYACQVEEQHYLARKDGGAFDKHEYRNNPELYKTEFVEKIGSYSSVIVNGAYWDKKYPRLLSNAQLRKLQEATSSTPPQQRPLAIADISCDINGGIECLSHNTQIEQPFFYYDAVKGLEHNNAQGPGVQVLGVENLPSEMPLEASQFFSDRLYPHLVELLSGHPSTVLDNAEICANGKLGSKHQHLAPHAASCSVSSREQKRVLLLGSGFVAAPLVDYLVQHNIHVTIASASLEEAKKLANSDQTEARQINLPHDKQALHGLIKDHDVTVSFVPAPMHPEIAEVCIENQRHLVTASYISDEMRSFDELAKERDVALINEMGLDPGIDHMSAMKMIDRIHEQGGKVTSFISWCGGLPAPEYSDVPLGYKFSWSPRGVLSAATNNAKFKYNDEMFDIEGKDLLKFPFQRLSLYPGFNLEGLANRDSLKYPEMYGLKASEMTTFFRGTLRYLGFSKQMQIFKDLGFFNTKPFEKAQNFPNWRKFTQAVIDSQRNFASNEAATLIDWLLEGCLHVPVSGVQSPMDGLARLLEFRLAYQPGERDLVILHHSFGVKFPKSDKEKVFTSSLVTFGTFGTIGQTTAMAKTVGLPAAMAVRLLLTGKVKSRGIVTPTTREIYEPVLEELAKHDVKIIEREQPTHLKNLYLNVLS